MTLLLIELVDSFAIAICHPRRAHRLQVSVHSLLHTCICDGHELRFVLPLVILWPADKFLVNRSFAVNRLKSYF